MNIHIRTVSEHRELQTKRALRRSAVRWKMEQVFEDEEFKMANNFKLGWTFRSLSIVVVAFFRKLYIQVYVNINGNYFLVKRRVMRKRENRSIYSIESMLKRGVTFLRGYFSTINFVTLMHYYIGTNKRA